MTTPTKEQDQAYEFIKAITDAVTEDEFPLALVNAVAALTAERDDYKAALTWMASFTDEYLQQMTKGTTLHIDMSGKAKDLMRKWRALATPAVEGGGTRA